MSNSTIFLEKDTDTLLTKLREKQFKDHVERNNLILEVIRRKAPLSKYGLAKMVGLAYPTIKRIVKEFEFCNLVRVKAEYSAKTGLPVKMIQIIFATEVRNE